MKYEVYGMRYTGMEGMRVMLKDQLAPLSHSTYSSRHI